MTEREPRIDEWWTKIGEGTPASESGPPGSFLDRHGATTSRPAAGGTTPGDGGGEASGWSAPGTARPASPPTAVPRPDPTLPPTPIRPGADPPVGGGVGGRRSPVTPAASSSGPEPGGGRRTVAPGDGAVVTTIWGGTSSGKSTFLWTLPLAVDEAGWTVTGVDRASSAFLSDARQALLDQRVLPTATLDQRAVHWELRSRGRRGLLRRKPPALIDLRMTDRPGRAFQRPDEALIDELEASDAIVFLFDAQREYDERDAFTFFGATMDALRERMRTRLPASGELPQHLAVCVAKLDEVAMVHAARRGLWLTQDPRAPYLPRVADDHAEDFFDWLCRDPRARTARSIRQLIRNNFAPTRTRYWATSAVGFNVPSGGVVDLADPDNLRMVAGQYRLRTPPRPVNVLEPLVALHRDVARSSR